MTLETSNTPSLSLSDLNAVLQIISVCSQRGAFKAEELSSVGLIHDRILAFVNSQTPEQLEKEKE